MTVCQHCHGTVAPIPAVVLGLVQETEAPLLTSAWLTTRRLLDLNGDDFTERKGLVNIAAEWSGAKPGTVENLLRAAAQLGLVDVRYHEGGTPRRRRAYVRLAPGRNR